MPTPEYFAMYVQLVRDTDGVIERRQFICLPRPKNSETVLYFQRAQDTKNHRSRWRHFRLNALEDGGKSPFMHVLSADALKGYKVAGWKLDKPVVARVEPYALEQLYREPNTPYELLRVFEKNARKEGYRI